MAVAREERNALVVSALVVSSSRSPLVGHLARFSRGRLLASLRQSRAADGETMADEFTFLGVAAGIGLVLLMILFI